MALLPIKRKEGTVGGLNNLSRMHDDMHDLVRSFFGPNWNWPTNWSGGAAWPAIDVADHENEYLVKAEVPGCKAEDIDISISGNVLTISGEKKVEKEVKEKDYYHSERSFGSFRRDLNLATDVDSTKIEAECKNGVLTVKLPKSEKAKPAKIKIKG